MGGKISNRKIIEYCGEKIMPPKKDITGQVFGNLKAIRCTGEKYEGLGV